MLLVATRPSRNSLLSCWHLNQPQASLECRNECILSGPFPGTLSLYISITEQKWPENASQWIFGFGARSHRHERSPSDIAGDHRGARTSSSAAARPPAPAWP